MLKKHKAALARCSDPGIVHDNPLGAPASVKLVDSARMYPVRVMFMGPLPKTHFFKRIYILHGNMITKWITPVTCSNEITGYEILPH